jgi:hypothetical protein
VRRDRFDRLPPDRQAQVREQARAQARAWKKANPDKVAAWLANNQHRLAEYSRRYQAKKRLARRAAEPTG